MAKKPIIRYFDRGVWYDATVSDIGNLEDLNTIHKTTVVEAINDIVGGNFTISGNLLDRFNELDESIAGLDEMITSGTLNENQAEKINQFVVEKLNELNQSMEELNKQRDQRLKEQEDKVAQLKLDSESDKQRIEEITGDLNATKERLNNAELNVTSVTELVDEINGKISQAVSKTDFDLLEGTVREQKTLIDQTAEGIKLLATKEELDKTNENVKSIKSEVDVQAGLIESKVSSEQLVNEIDKIDKYMPNLLRYTRNWQDWENDDEANVDVTLNEYRDCIIQRARGIGKGLYTTVEDLEIGETYSLSVWVKHDDTNAKLYAMVDNEEIIMTDLNSKETFVGNEFKRMRCSFVAKDTTAKVRFIFKDCRTDSYGYLAGAKCEKNKKVSGWQPNSEDVYQSIKSARSEIKQTDDKITTLVETVTKQGDLISSNKSNIEQTDKAITLQAESIKTLNESIESAKAELKVNSDAIKSKVWKTDVGEMISDINIDNKNRVLNSDFGDGWELWSETNNLFQLKQIGNYKFAVAERSGLSQNMAIAIATNKFPVKHNERLMFGFYFYCADLSKLDNKIVGALELLDINDIRIDRVDFDVSKLSLKNGSFTKLTDTYFVEDERIVKARLRFFLNRNGNVGFALPMAQGGDIKSSDWSLAPEDVARRFNDTNFTITNYEQTVDGFRQTVESYKGSIDGYSSQVSEFNQNVNGFRQDVTTYKNNLNGRIDQLQTSLNTESGRITAVVAESSKTKNDLATLTGENGRIAQLELTANGLKSTVASQSSSIQTIQTDTTSAKQLANDAYSKANSAVTSASNASSTANSALSKASDATSVANSANQNATNAVASANTAVSTANTAKTNADKAIADVAALTKTVTTQSTRIDQTSSRIDQVASGVTEIGGRIDNLSNNYYQKSTVDSKISTATSGITAQYTSDINTKLANYYDKSTMDRKLTIDGLGIETYVKNTQSKLDNLQVGGRNYLIGTNKEYRAFNLGQWAAILNTRNLADLNLKVGDYITASCDVKVPSNAIKGGKIRVQFFNSDADRTQYYGEICNIGEEKRLKATVYIDSKLLQYKRIDLLIESTNTSITAVESGIQSRHEKLDIGNTATDWSPAPEDMATLTQYTEVKQLADRISSTVYDSASGLVSKTTQLANSYAIKQLNSAGDILTSLNLNANTSTAEIDAKLIRLNGYTKMDDAFINNLVANSIVTNKIKATEISGNVIKGGTIQGVTLKSTGSGAEPGEVEVNDGTIAMEKQEVGPSGRYFNRGFVSPLEMTMSKVGPVGGKVGLIRATSFTPFGLYNQALDTGNNVQNHKLFFHYQGLSIESDGANSGVGRNSGLKIFGDNAYIDLKPSILKDPGDDSDPIKMRIIATPNNTFEFRNDYGNIYMMTKNKENIVVNGYKIPYTFTDNNMGIRVARIANPTSSGAYLELSNMVGKAWGVSMWASDQRLKSNIQSPTQDALFAINQLAVRQFDWKSDGKHEEFGLIAQEVEKILPDAVFKVGDYYQIKESGLIPVLIGAVQKLSNKVNLLENILMNTKGSNLI